MEFFEEFQSLLEEDHHQFQESKICSALEVICNKLATRDKGKVGGGGDEVILEYLIEKTKIWNKFKELVRLKDGHEKFVLVFLKLIETILPVQDAASSDKESHYSIIVRHDIGAFIISLFYEQQLPPIMYVPAYGTEFRFHSLMLLAKIANDAEFAEKWIGELIGIFKGNVDYGLGNNNECSLRFNKVLKSQQTYHTDGAEDLLTGDDDAVRSVAGGKVQRKRKLRVENIPAANNSTTDRLNMWNLPDNINFNIEFLDITPSDSEASASEMHGATTEQRYSLPMHSSKKRHQDSKVRQAALYLLSVLTSKNKRNLLYGYWHSLFPSCSAAAMTEQHNSEVNNLLHVGRKDPSVRCRKMALQVATQLILDSRAFLIQAEYDVKRFSTSFLPFSHSLGMLVLGMFDALIEVLSKEWTRSVILQALKCLAVLVQATTPFQKFQPRDFIGRFVEQIRSLLNVKDTNIQVAALIVMEFLISSPELTPEIAEVLNFPCHKLKSMKSRFRVKNELNVLEEVVDSEEYFDECIDDEIDPEDAEDQKTVETKAINQNANTDTEAVSDNGSLESSWLLEYIFNQFDAGNNTFRVAALQVLAASAKHLELLLPYLHRISNLLTFSLKHPEVNIRHHSARFLDQLSYQIAQHLLQVKSQKYLLNSSAYEETASSDEDLNKCIQFWSTLLPIVMEEIQNIRHVPVPIDNSENLIKSSLCDALSDIGMVIFESQQQHIKISLLGFLSGIASDDRACESVRVSAVRALAIYSTFPTMRSDLVFIENTLNLALVLTKSKNLPVRIKAIWSIGNITDVLASNYLNTSTKDDESDGTRHSMISDSLYWDLHGSILDACNDKDKVRCNAVRALGNLLLLFTKQKFDNKNNRLMLHKSIQKLIVNIRSSKYVKVKWNACYAIGMLLQNEWLFEATRKYEDLNWETSLFPELAKVIIQHSNFKVRISLAIAFGYISNRSNYGKHFELLWSSVLCAIEQSYHLDNFYEYNHRDQLQEQLCLLLCNLLTAAIPDDFVVMKKHLEIKMEIVRSTWTRVINRMAPEKAAPLIECYTLLHEKLRKTQNLSAEKLSAIKYLIEVFSVS